MTSRTKRRGRLQTRSVALGRLRIAVSTMLAKPSPLPRAQPTRDIVDSVFVLDRALYRFAHTIVTRKVVERGLLPQRAPFSKGTSGYALNAPLQ
jgi:hypothetical protein